MKLTQVRIVIMYWISVSSKLIRFVLHFGHKYLYHTHIKRLIKNFVCRSVISYLVSFLLFCKLHNSLLVIISILFFYPFDHRCDSMVVIFHRLFALKNPLSRECSCYAQLGC